MDGFRIIGPPALMQRLAATHHDTAPDDDDDDDMRSRSRARSVTQALAAIDAVLDRHQRYDDLAVGGPLHRRTGDSRHVMTDEGWLPLRYAANCRIVKVR
jgi:hypothetical protein